LLLVSTAVWLSWREPAEIAAAETRAGAMGAPKEPSGHPAARVLRLNPDPEVADRQSNRLRTKNVLQNAAGIEPAVGGPHPSNSVTDLLGANSADNPRPGLTNSPGEPPPSLDVTTSIKPEELTGLSSEPATLPAFGARVSTGATEGNLIYKVDPTYPPEARTQKLAGSVVLDASIAEDGSIQEVKVLSGPPLLAAAATAAVQQWRYRPSRLDGKPIAVRKRITIIFKNP
jgi:TonB family protein